MVEQWKTINEAPDYEVSNAGRVRRARPDWQGKYAGRILRAKNHRGYASVVLCTSSGHFTRKVHRLVCEAFNGPCPQDKAHCAHRNGDRSDNTPENLYWATALENAADRERHGRTARGERSGAALHPEKWARGNNHWTNRLPDRVPRGENHYRRRDPRRIPRGSAVFSAKLTEEDALAIIKAPRTHGSGRELAERYGVSMGLISAIRSGRAWAHLPR